MGPQLLFWLLGAAFALPCTGALTCYKGVILKFGQNLMQQPQNLITGNTDTCARGEACQETVLFIESGTRGIIVGSKGCIAAGFTSSGPTRILSPGVTIISYNRVCSSDLCNSINSTDSILTLPPPAAPSPDGLQCPMCVALGSCSSTALSLCPNGTSRCYRGLLQLHGGGISSDLGIQGCAPKAISGCNLLRHNQAFGPIAVSEICEGQSEGQSSTNSPPIVSASKAQTWGMELGLLLALWRCLPLL